MGRYIAMGLLAEFKMERYDDCSNYDFRKDEGKILNKLNRYIDVSKYDKVVCEDSMFLTIKKDFFYENIHELLKEVYQYAENTGCFFDDLAYGSNRSVLNNFSQETYPIELSRHYDEYSKCDSFFIKSGNDKDEKEYRLYEPYPSDKWLFYDGRDDFYKNFCFKNEFVILWEANNKIFTEDEVLLSIMLNKMKDKYFISPLSKNMIFTIIG